MRQIFTKYFKGDRVVWAVIIMLFIFSLLTVYSATGTLAYKYKGGNTTYYLLRHARFLVFGLIIIYLTHRIPYQVFSRLSQLLFALSIPLLLFTLFIGVTKNEASRWLTLPGLGIDFQTSDLAKIALIMYVARILSLNQENKEDLKEAFKPIMIAVIAICGLIFPANFSTAALLFATCWILMYIGRMDLRYLWISVGIIVAAISIFLIFTLSTDMEGRVGTWKKRIESFVSSDGQHNFQADQSKIAIVTGGMLGKGPGNSTQRNFLPHPYSDFIFAIIIEEYGSLGGAFVLFLYLYLLYRTGVIVRRAKRTFPALLAIGLTISLVIQALTNMAVAVNLFPVTGQPLPFISMGGTSILFTSVAFGIILSISRSIEQQNKEAEAQLA